MLLFCSAIRGVCSFCFFVLIYVHTLQNETTCFKKQNLRKGKLEKQRETMIKRTFLFNKQYEKHWGEKEKQKETSPQKKNVLSFEFCVFCVFTMICFVACCAFVLNMCLLFFLCFIIIIFVFCVFCFVVLLYPLLLPFFSLCCFVVVCVSCSCCCLVLLFVFVFPVVV